MCDVGCHESPREIPALFQVKNEGCSNVGGDCSAVNGTEVVVDAFFASRNEPAGVRTKVGTRVDQEQPCTNSLRGEKAACGFSADMCRR
jgi:hypothetical protein